MQNNDEIVIPIGGLTAPAADPERDLPATATAVPSPEELRTRLGQETARRTTLEREIAGLREQLKSASRHASMAEVATGAVHNISNVLTSMNVSVELVLAQLKKSRVQNLSKAVGMLRERQNDCAAFLTQDPKGKMLPGYLETLAHHLAAEQEALLREMESLVRSIEHVKEIVIVQQSYSRYCGLLESLPPAELVQDAIRMNQGAFERHGIQIVREFCEVPPVTVDRHKVLQILINLMRNAKYALDEQGPPQKRLVLGIARNGPDRVVLSVRDNGIGISAQNRVHLFEHGFTTKPDGHGFGLSSGILAAREMGGELTCYSDGIGQGALFCLELPVAQNRKDHCANADSRGLSGPQGQ